MTRGCAENEDFQLWWSVSRREVVSLWLSLVVRNALSLLTGQTEETGMGVSGEAFSWFAFHSGCFLCFQPNWPTKEVILFSRRDREDIKLLSLLLFNDLLKYLQTNLP